MERMRLKFPHISRFFSASLLWLGLLSLITYNVRVKMPDPDVLVHPGLAMAREKQTQVLGAQTSQKIEFWKSIIAARPDYRDAYTQLASLSYTQGNLAGAGAYLSQALSLAPNNDIIQNLLAFVSRLTTPKQ